MTWPMLLAMVLEIPKHEARQQLMSMDAMVYGNRIHAGKESQFSFDMLRYRIEKAAYPDD